MYTTPVSSPIDRAIRPYRAELTVYYGESWYWRFPQLVQVDSGDPFDITAATIEVVVRPSASHATEFARLTSVGSAGIQKENAVKGLAAIFYSQASVESHFPLSLANGWWHMQRITFTDSGYGSIKKILAEGPFLVRPARDV